MPEMCTGTHNGVPSAAGHGWRVLRLCWVMYNTLNSPGSRQCSKAPGEIKSQCTRHNASQGLGSSYPGCCQIRQQWKHHRPWPAPKEPWQGEGDCKLYFPMWKIKAEWVTEAYRGEICQRAQNCHPISDLSIPILKQTATRSHCHTSTQGQKPLLSFSVANWFDTILHLFSEIESPRKKLAVE